MVKGGKGMDGCRGLGSGGDYVCPHRGHKGE